MKLFKGKGAMKKTGALIGLKTSIRGRKLLRKQKRLQKKKNRAVFAARMQRNLVSGKQSPMTKSNKIKQLKVMIEAAKATLKEGKATEASEKTVKVNGKSSETDEKEPEEDGFQPSTTSKNERMARLQEFVNQEAGISESKTTQPGNSDQVKDDEKPNLIKDKETLKVLRNKQKEDTKEINKLGRLLRMTKPQKKKVSSIFAEDFGGLLQDIEEGSLSHAEKYKTDENIDEGDNSDEEFERDMATALGKNVSKKAKKSKASEAVVEDKGKRKIKKELSVGKEDPENEFRKSDFNPYARGNLSDDEEYDDFEYEDEEAIFVGGGYGDDNYSDRRKSGRAGRVSQENGEEYEYFDGENEEADESKFSNDDGEEDGYDNVKCSGDEDSNENEDSKFSNEEEGKFEDGYDMSKFSGNEDGDEVIAGKFSDGDYSDSDDEDGDESKVSGEDDDEEEGDDEDGYFDMEAEEDSEADEESDDDGELTHDFRDEPEYAFEGGSGYYSKPEILKNGMENDIDHYSSNSEDDVDLEGFVVGDDEVKFEDVSDELPDELSDSPSPVKKRKKTRIILQSDDESEGKRSDHDESGKEENGEKEDFFCARGLKNKYQEGEDAKESLGTKSESEDQEKEQDTSSDEGSDEDMMSEKATKKRKMSAKEERSVVKRRKLVIEDESVIIDSSVEKTVPKTSGPENEDSPQTEPNKISFDENYGDISRVQNGDALETQTKKTKKKKKLDENSEETSTLDSEDVQMVKPKKKVDDENDADVSTMDSVDVTLGKSKKKKKKLTNQNDDDSTMDNEDSSQIKIKKKKKKSGGENKEDDPTVRSEDVLQIKKKSLEEDNNEDASTVDTENASQTKIKKKKNTKKVMIIEEVLQTKTNKKTKHFEHKSTGDFSAVDSEDAAKTKKTLEDESTVESEDVPQIKTKKKFHLNSGDDPTVESEDIPQNITKTKKRKLDDDEDIFTVDSEDAPRLKPKKKNSLKKEGNVSAPKIKTKSEEVLQKSAKTSGKGSDESLDKPTYKRQSGEEKTTGKPVTKRKLVPLPEMSSDEEEVEVEDDNEELEGEMEEEEEEEGYIEEEEEEGYIEEEEYFDEEEEEIEEEEYTEEEEEDMDDGEEEEEEEEDMDEEEEEEEEAAQDQDISTKQKTNRSTTQQDDDGTTDDTLTEDIYGRLRDKHGNIIKQKEPGNDGESGRYVPPALRKLTALHRSKEKKEQLAALRRTLKGLMNRLAESNMGGIASEVEGMYLRHARNDVNEVLSGLLMEAVVGPSLTPDRLVQELALLVALLSANVGSEVGAHILNEFVLKWNDELERLSPEAEGGSKELDNLLLFIAHLYAFRVVEARLVYDVLHRLTCGFSGKEVELILLVLRSVGFNLRKDGPLALKALITEIQARAAQAQEKSTAAAGSSRKTAGGDGVTEGGGEGAEYSRLTFMLEVIQAVRNNNMSKLPNYDPAHMDHLRQVLRGLVRKGRQPPQLNVTLEDMLKARECGRWWVVGSAWSGGLVGEQTDQQSDAKNKKSHRPALDTKFSDAFMRKAAKLQLSRPPRVNILYILTEGSEDYLDAFEKLLQLSLPQPQERELFSVVLLCCQKGKLYNPFFSHLADRMCKFDKKYVRLLQFALWDKFEEVEDMKAREVSNLAKFVTHLVGENGLNLTIFKHISFMDAEKQMISLIRQVLITLLLHPAGTDAVEQTFSILSASPKLKVLRQSLRIFILKFIKAKRSSEDTNYAMLSKRIETAVEKLRQGGGVRL